MHSRTARVALLYAGLALAGAPISAQQPAQANPPQDTTAGGASMHEMMRTMGMMAGCPMMEAMGRGPAAALRARNALHLSPAQVQRLEAAQRQVEQAHTLAMDSMRVLHPHIAALADAPRFDERAARAAFERAGRLHADVGVATVRAQYEVSQILTPPQRDSLASLGRSQMGGMGMMGPGGAAGMDACASMMQMGTPGAKKPAAKPNSAHDHQHRADSTTGRP